MKLMKMVMKKYSPHDNNFLIYNRKVGNGRPRRLVPSPYATWLVTTGLECPSTSFLSEEESSGGMNVVDILVVLEILYVSLYYYPNLVENISCHDKFHYQFITVACSSVGLPKFIEQI